MAGFESPRTWATWSSSCWFGTVTDSTGEFSGEEMVMRSFTQAFFRAQMWDNHIDDENNLNAAAIYRYLKLIVRYSGNWGLNIDDTEKVNHSRPSTSFLPPFLLFFWAGGWGFEGWKGRHSLDFQQNYEYVRSVIEKMTSFICRVMYEFYFLSFFFWKIDLRLMTYGRI